MGEFDGIDFFRGNELVADPYPYFDHLRAQCPVQHEPKHDVVMVTGYDEAVSVFTNTTTFSSCNAVTGPFPGFPVPLEGDDVSDLIEQHRDELPFSDQIIVMDPPKHKAHRGLLMRLITPKRLKENEDFMWRYADRQIDEIIERGECEFIRDFAGPFTLYVIADLLGVPEEDHEWFREELQGGGRNRPQGLGSTGSGSLSHSPLEFLYERITAYVEDRRREPRARRPHRAGNGDLPRRVAARGDRGRPRRGQRVLGRAGDHGPPARDGVADDRREPRHPGPLARRSPRSSPASSRSACVSRARSRGTSACPGRRRRSGASTSPPARP